MNPTICEECGLPFDPDCDQKGFSLIRFNERGQADPAGYETACRNLSNRVMGRAIQARTDANPWHLPRKYATATYHGYPKSVANLSSLKAAHDLIIAWDDATKRDEHGIPRADQVAFIHGPRGTGKSCLAAAAFARAEREGYSCLWGFVSQVLKAIQAEFDTPGGERAVFGSLCACDLLVLDDMGSGHQWTDWAVATIKELIECRYREQRPTIITTQMRERDFSSSADLLSIYDRASRDGLDVPITGESLRGSIPPKPRHQGWKDDDREPEKQEALPF